MSIECQGVSKRFGSTQALEEISLTLESGHIYGLLGNNGAGKSTLLSILTDRQLPDQGTVTIDGVPIRNNDKALEKVFLVGEQNLFPEDMKVPGFGVGRAAPGPFLPAVDRKVHGDLLYDSDLHPLDRGGGKPY